MQGETITFGPFSDPVTAARKHDREAIKYKGASAILNFTIGNAGATLASEETQPAQLPLGGRCAQEGPATRELLPAVTAEGALEPVSRTMMTMEANSGVSSCGVAPFD